jgi:hypothetical protein
MARFLKLTNMLINTNDIHKIIINPNKYYIYIMTKKFNGFTWLIGGSGVGFASSHEEQIEVCKTKHSTDYKIVTEWINKN